MTCEVVGCGRWLTYVPVPVKWYGILICRARPIPRSEDDVQHAFSPIRDINIYNIYIHNIYNIYLAHNI